MAGIGAGGRNHSNGHGSAAGGMVRSSSLVSRLSGAPGRAHGAGASPFDAASLVCKQLGLGAAPKRPAAAAPRRP